MEEVTAPLVNENYSPEKLNSLDQESLQPKLNKNKFFAIVIVIFIIMAIVGVASVIVLNAKPSLKHVTLASPSVSLSPTITHRQTIKGKTYTNDQFGYTIIYPTNWEAAEAPSVPVTYPPITQQPRVGGYLQKGELQKITFINTDIGSCSLSILENPKHMSLDQWASSYKALSATGANLAKVTGDTTFGGRPAKTLSIFAFDHSDTVITGEYNGNIYFFEYSNTKDNPNYTPQQQSSESICLQIASSLQFLHSN